MITAFKNLSETEVSSMMDAVPLVTALISGADGEFSKAEKDWAEKLVGIRAYDQVQSMSEYYAALEANFPERLQSLIKELPENTEERNLVISQNLSKLNNILPKLDNNFAHRFYKNLLSFAKQVAEADGGFLRFATISKDEKKWLNLNMITPVELEEDDT